LAILTNNFFNPALEILFEWLKLSLILKKKLHKKKNYELEKLLQPFFFGLELHLIDKLPLSN